MKIGVAGLWHLGVMYSTGFAELGHEVIAYDPNPNSILGFNKGKLLVFEPGLQDILIRNVKANRLKFTDQEADLRDIELLILAYDTPVDDQDTADAEFVIFEFKRIIENLNPNVDILVSSQLPVGSSDLIVKIIENSGHYGNVIVQPENLRLGKAVESFFNPERIIAGTHDGKSSETVIKAFKGINAPIIWMHRKSAEMTKHALNAYLATSVTFMGELAEICEKVGADAKEVEIGLKSDPRIGPKAYLSPGLGFAGGTLARDVRKLSDLQGGIRAEPAIFTSLLISNRRNNDWISRSLLKIPLKVNGLRICFWGVSYTENTDTLRRSEIYLLMKKLNANSAIVSYVENRPIKDEMDSGIICVSDLEESLRKIDVLVVSKNLTSLSKNIEKLKRLKEDDLWILDPSRILVNFRSNFVDSPKYLTVGKGI